MASRDIVRVRRVLEDRLALAGRQVKGHDLLVARRVIPLSHGVEDDTCPRHDRWEFVAEFVCSHRRDLPALPVGRHPDDAVQTRGDQQIAICIPRKPRRGRQLANLDGRPPLSGILTIRDSAAQKATHCPSGETAGK